MDKSQNAMCNIINQLFLIEQKVMGKEGSTFLKRRFDRINDELKTLHYTFLNPLGERYDPSRIDYEASISGEGAEEMNIIEVIKPIIFHGDAHARKVLQRGIVIVAGTK